MFFKIESAWELRCGYKKAELLKISYSCLNKDIWFDWRLKSSFENMSTDWVSLQIQINVVADEAWHYALQINPVNKITSEQSDFLESSMGKDRHHTSTPWSPGYLLIWAEFSICIDWCPQLSKIAFWILKFSKSLRYDASVSEDRLIQHSCISRRTTHPHKSIELHRQFVELCIMMTVFCNSLIDVFPKLWNSVDIAK